MGFVSFHVNVIVGCLRRKSERNGVITVWLPVSEMVHLFELTSAHRQARWFTISLIEFRRTPTAIFYLMRFSPVTSVPVWLAEWRLNWLCAIAVWSGYAGPDSRLGNESAYQRAGRLLTLAWPLMLLDLVVKTPVTQAVQLTLTSPSTLFHYCTFPRSTDLLGKPYWIYV